MIGGRKEELAKRERGGGEGRGGLSGRSVGPEAFWELFFWRRRLRRRRRRGKVRVFFSSTAEKAMQKGAAAAAAVGRCC